MKKNQKVKIINKKNQNLPRLIVVRSNKFIYAQLINDKNGAIIAGMSSIKSNDKTKPIENATKVGLDMAKIIKAKYKKIVFDRKNYLFHGQVKALAEGLKQGGVKF